MGKGVVFKLNLPGLNEIMKSAPMCETLNAAAQKIARSAGNGYEVETAHPISFVGIAAVHAKTREARKDNNDNNTLLKAAGGTRI